MIINNLRNILEKQDKSLYWLSKEINVSYTTLHKILKNETDSIKFKILEDMCTALNVELNEMLEIKKE